MHDRAVGAEVRGTGSIYLTHTKHREHDSSQRWHTLHGLAFDVEVADLC